MRQCKHLAALAVAGLTALMLSGCSTSKDEMLPPGDSTMLELWNNGASTTHATAESRTTLRRPVSAGLRQRTHDRTTDPGQLQPHPGK